MRSSSLFSSVISLALSTAASASFPASSQGCFNKTGTLQNTGSYIFQSIDHCVNECGKAEYKFVGVQGEDCWCGDSLPSLDDLVSDDKCDTACPGYGADICGGDNAWSIYEIGSIEPSAWLSSTTSTGGSTSTATESTSSTESDSSTATSPTTTSTTSTTSPSTSDTTSTAPSASPESSSTVSETPSSTSASIESTPTGNSANRRYSFLF